MLRKKQAAFILLVAMVLLTLSAVSAWTGINSVKAQPTSACSKDRYVYILVDISASAQEMDREGVTRLSILGDIFRYLITYQMLAPQGKTIVQVIEYTSAFGDGGYREVLGKEITLDGGITLAGGPNTRGEISLEKIMPSEAGKDLKNVFEDINKDIRIQRNMPGKGKIEDVVSLARSMREKSNGKPNSLVILISQGIISSDRDGDEVSTVHCRTTAVCLEQAIDEWERGTARPNVVAFLFNPRGVENIWVNEFKRKDVGEVKVVTGAHGGVNSQVVWESLIKVFERLGWLGRKIKNSNCVYHRKISEQSEWEEKGKIGILNWDKKNSISVFEYRDGHEVSVIYKLGVVLTGISLAETNSGEGNLELSGGGEVWIGEFPKDENVVYVKANGEILFRREEEGEKPASTNTEISNSPSPPPSPIVTPIPTISFPTSPGKHPKNFSPSKPEEVAFFLLVIAVIVLFAVYEKSGIRDMREYLWKASIGVLSGILIGSFFLMVFAGAWKELSKLATVVELCLFVLGGGVWSVRGWYGKKLAGARGSVFVFGVSLLITYYAIRTFGDKVTPQAVAWILILGLGALLEFLSIYLRSSSRSEASRR